MNAVELLSVNPRKVQPQFGIRSPRSNSKYNPDLWLFNLICEVIRPNMIFMTPDVCKNINFAQDIDEEKSS